MGAVCASERRFPFREPGVFFVAKIWKDGFRGKAVFDMERWKWWAISCKRLLWPRARLFLKALSYTCLFYLGNMLKNICFFSDFPLAGSMAGGFYWLFLWNFKR